MVVVATYRHRAIVRLILCSIDSTLLQVNNVASREEEDTSTLRDLKGKIVRKFSYEELRRLIAAPGPTGELNSFVRITVVLNLV